MLTISKRNTLFLLGALMLSPAYFPGVAAASTQAQVAPIGELFERWNRLLVEADIEGLVGLYAADAVLLPTASNQPRVGVDGIKAYFQGFLADKPASEINHREVRFPSENIALDMGTYTFTLNPADGSERKVKARYTFVYQRAGEGWKILNHHSSAMPEAVHGT
jgi:uncharacterized protein (TIGR02246 family)